MLHLAAQRKRSRVTGMTVVMKALTLVALLLMPVGMSSPAAAAQHAPVRAMAMMEHCHGQAQEEEAPASAMDCSAMCTAFLAGVAAMPASAPGPLLRCTLQREKIFTGIEPELTTPPPRQG